MVLLIGGFDWTGFDGTNLEAAGAGFGAGLATAEFTTGLLAAGDFGAAGRLVILVSGLGGRGSESSALRFIPTFPVVGARASVGFRSSLLETAAGAGEAGAWDRGDDEGFPVWIDVRMESRNWLRS